jgi:hypothetical protein
MFSNLVNQLGVNGVWFACVLGAAYGHAWLGSACAFVWIAWTLQRHANWRRELAVVLFAGALGFVADLVLIPVGGLAYAGQPPGAPGPLWIVALWMAFGTSLNVSLAWLHGRAWLAAILGAISGPLAYLAGRQLGAVVFGPPDREPLLVLSIVWAIALPLLVIVAARAHPQGPDVPQQAHADAP